MEIQPLCRYHFHSKTIPKDYYLTLDILPNQNSEYDQYTLKYVNSSQKQGSYWFEGFIQEIDREVFEGKFVDIKSKMLELIVEAFKNGFKCEVSYLPAYFE